MTMEKLPGASARVVARSRQLNGVAELLNLATLPRDKWEEAARLIYEIDEQIIRLRDDVAVAEARASEAAGNARAGMAHAVSLSLKELEWRAVLFPETPASLTAEQFDAVRTALRDAIDSDAAMWID